MKEITLTDREREVLAQVMECANDDYWATSPPDGWGTYGVWDHIAATVASYLEDDDPGKFTAIENG